MASEDKRFLYHNGVDYWGLARSGGLAITSGRLTGASTLSMQLARRLLLTDLADTGFVQKAKRKAWEIVTASEIENLVSKHDVLRAYLNVGPLGRGSFGFEAAAQRYLGKSARDLTVMEAAMLVGMLPAPAARDPWRHPDRALAATLRVLKRMDTQGYLSRSTADNAVNEARQRLGHSIELVDPASHQVSGPEFRRVRDYAREELTSKGVRLPERYRIFVTLSPSLQQHLDAIQQSEPRGYGLAGVVLGRDGAILAVAGSSFPQSQWNAAWKANRSVGSIGKIPILLAAAKTPGMLDQIVSAEALRGSYSPAEPDHRCQGRLSVQDSLRFSCNRPFVRLAYEVGNEAALLSKELGFTVPNNHLLIPTGGLNGNPMKIATMMNMIASNGRFFRPYATVAIAKGMGEIVYRKSEPSSRRVTSVDVARKVGSLLRHPVRSGGTGHLAAGTRRAAAVYGKTGTSDGNKDAIFAGYTNDWTAVITYQRSGPSRIALAGGGKPARDFGALVDWYWPAKNLSETSNGNQTIGETVHRLWRFGINAVEWVLLWGALALVLRGISVTLASLMGLRYRSIVIRRQSRQIA
ncbi:transglycosylase domain-containing protein [Sinorhizobium sp. BG8]|uniref:transglycosylase domain-containing protein n=1 Tax=Sinorhizobium sp. BG8 TaxID=2613773 RepID=UPI001FEE8485|nr:transglycosylase domain-containing protein [Sinorhizobium sp. BG8]